jgi:hypothetical protein
MVALYGQRIYEIIQLLLSSGGGLLTFSISAIRRSKTLPIDEENRRFLSG